ncbi:hypothetical protein BV25DRAFT_1862761 [Artomyces pyxidatus]|uniref:Uncharacterized protein n=1 Tax=Artomyces pyxidatus TaxID=48021 RepID=A0ACB8SQ20_9AGAM|nr:hypothetical protein BV25DRAFT_1862761 [Artomyces pyxidatus]
MSTPWKSPLFPAAPNPTPTVLPPPRALRPPIYNPYDKFTQPEFDAWIGDITGALRRALGREEEEEEKEETLPKQSIGDALLRARDGDASITAERGEELDEAEEDPSILEDSFAHVKSRRAKGKARDPREGPGLGKRDQPIEILSDSDEGSVDDAVSWHGSVDEDGEGQYYDDEASEEEDDDEEEEEEDWSRAGASRTVHVLSSDEEDEVGVTVDVQNAGDDDDGDGEHVRGIAGASKHAGESLDSEDVDLDVDVGAGDEEFPPLSKSPLSRTPEVADPWDGPRTYAEDFYSGGDRISPGPEVTPSHLTPNPASPIPIPGISADDDDFTITPGVLSPETSPPREVINVDEDVGPSAIQGSSPPADTEKDGLEDIYADLLVYPDAAMQPGPVQEEDREFAPSPATPHISRHTKGPATPEKSPIPAPHTPVSGDWDWLVRHVSHPGPTSPHVAETSAHVAGGSEDEADDDDEDEDHEIWGAMPLGTSDLDVQDGWGADEHAEVDDDDEEDEIQEFEPTGQEATVIDDVTIAVNAVDGVEGAFSISVVLPLCLIGTHSSVSTTITERRRPRPHFLPR